MPSDLSPRDKDLMVRTILGEAANEGPQGQAAVASVILNRAASGQYGATPSQVVLAPNQFEPWSTRRQELLGYKPDSAAYKNVADIVDMVASGDIPDQSQGATHFLNEGIVRQRRGGSLPNWAVQQTAKIGSHTFYAPQGKVDASNTGDVDKFDIIQRAINGE